MEKKMENKKLDREFLLTLPVKRSGPITWYVLFHWL